MKTSLNDNSRVFRGLLSIWPIVLLSLLTPFALPSILVGHPWKAELALSIILGAIITYIAACQLQIKAFSIFSVKPVRLIILSITLFIVWSGFSVIWAASTGSVFHHTLVWAAYISFLFISLHIASSDRLLRLSFYSLAAVTSIIATVCIVEYLFLDGIDLAFQVRYGRYAEVWAAILPLFLSFVLRLKGRHMISSAVVTSILWLGIVFSSSRGGLAAALVGLAIFGLLRLFANTKQNDKKKLVIAMSGLLLLGILAQFTALAGSNQSKTSTLSRFMTNSETAPSNSVSKNLRFLYWTVGLEIWRTHPVFGIGADNYGHEFNDYRGKISARPENRQLVQGNEEAMPERAHNEFIQIFSELGVIGGLIFLIFLCSIFKFSFTEVRKGLSSSQNILTHAAIGGIAAFLASSVVSSFSFRVVQNGIVFFFLLALLLRNSVRQKHAISKAPAISGRLRLVISSVGLLLCIGLFAFSSFKAASQYLTSKAEHEQNFEQSQAAFTKAIDFDKENAAAHFFYGMALLNQANYSDAAVEYSNAIRNGLATSTVYSYLISARSLAHENDLAIAAAADAIEHYPYSTFLRVRYALLLNAAGKISDADAQLKIAKSIDIKQAETWQILIRDGAYRAAEAGRSGIGVPNISDLYPTDAVYAVLADRYINFPDEKFMYAPR